MNMLKLSVLALMSIILTGAQPIWANPALPSIAQIAESGSLYIQQPSAGNSISTAQMAEAKAYVQFEKQVTSNITNGPKLAAIINDFDYYVAQPVADSVDSKIYALIKSAETVVHEKSKESLPKWAIPIYDYAEGIQEGHLEGNLGKVLQPYVKINDELRDSKPDSQETIDWVKQMRNSLSYLPMFEGISFRGARLTKEDAERFYSVGRIAVDKAFISSSMRPEIALRFALPMYNLDLKQYQKLNILFIIKGYSGRPISPLAVDHNDEAEIIFANGTQFRVVAKSPLFTYPDGPDIPEIRGKSQIIYLEEEAALYQHSIQGLGANPHQVQ